MMAIRSCIDMPCIARKHYLELEDLELEDLELEDLELEDKVW
jgi:hypothetical protein